MKRCSRLLFFTHVSVPKTPFDGASVKPMRPKIVEIRWNRTRNVLLALVPSCGTWDSVGKGNEGVKSQGIVAVLTFYLSWMITDIYHRSEIAFHRMSNTTAGSQPPCGPSSPSERADVSYSATKTILVELQCVQVTTFTICPPRSDLEFINKPWPAPSRYCRTPKKQNSRGCELVPEGPNIEKQ